MNKFDERSTVHLDEHNSPNNQARFRPELFLVYVAATYRIDYLTGYTGLTTLSGCHDIQGRCDVNYSHTVAGAGMEACVIQIRLFPTIAPGAARLLTSVGVIGGREMTQRRSICRVTAVPPVASACR